MIKKKVIFGCESRGDAGSAYLTRWTLMATRYGSLYLHKFHRSDGLEQHDHPWPFWSVVLWPGYREVTPSGSQRRWPLLPAFRPATYRHRVQLLLYACPKCGGAGTDFLTWDRVCRRCQGRCRLERSCWTIVWTGPRVREWGFFTRSGWQNWREYFVERGC